MQTSLETHLEQLVRRHSELREALASSGLSGSAFAKLAREFNELSPIIEGIAALQRAREELSSLADIVETSEDEELRQLADEESRMLRQRLPQLEQRVKVALLPPDMDDQRNAILEVRAGTGGEEAIRPAPAVQDEQG